MLKDSLGQTYQKVIALQVTLTLMFSTGAWLIGGLMAASSALVGGVSVAVGSLAYAFLNREIKASAKQILMRHLLGEGAKVLIVLNFILCALISGWFDVAWLVGAMGVALVGHWLAILLVH